MTTYKPIDLFGVPDDLNVSSSGSSKKKSRKVQREGNIGEASRQNKKIRSSSKTPAVLLSGLPGQAFLPGLSRRGRPRLEKPISAVERTAEHRRKRIANGAKRVEIILDSDVAQALDRLALHHQEPKSDVITTLIRKAAARLKVTIKD